MLIHTTPLDERPRERCLKRGSESLSLRECLALLIGTGPRNVGCLGLAHRLLTRAGEGMKDEEARAFFLALEGSAEANLSEIPGLANAARARLLAAFELARRYAIFREQSQRVEPASKRELPEYAMEALGRIPQELRSETSEWFGFVPCYPKGRVGGFCLIERGVRTHINLDPVELFARLLALRPGAFFLFHNHPSGDLRESPQDIDLTRRIRNLAQSFEITLMGHWIVTPKSEKWINLLCHQD